VDTMNLHYDSSRAVLSGVGVNLTNRDIARVGAKRSQEAFKELLKGKSDEEIKGIVDKKYALLMSKVKGIKPFPGFLEFLYSLKGKYLLAVCSSSRGGFVEFILKEIGVLDFFPVVVSAEDVFEGKPSPEPYIKTASLLGVSASECLVVEDSLAGIVSAKKAGAKIAAVATTHEKIFLQDADIIVDSLAELKIGDAEALFDA